MGVSVPLLLIIMFIYSYFTKLRTLNKKIVLNLAACLIVAQLLFAVGIGETDHEDLCSGVAVALHFFLLAAFTWSLVESYEIHQSFTAVFEHRRRLNPLRKYVAVGYLVPAAVVAVAAGGWFDGYGTDEYCWLSRDGDRVIWAFIAPIIVIVTINLVFFVRTMRVIWALPVNTSGANANAKIPRLRRAAKASLSFFAAMSLGWVFGLLAMIPSSSIVFQYLFAVANALQGVILFLFHCWLDVNVHHVLYRWQKGEDYSTMASYPTSSGTATSGSSRKSTTIARATVTCMDRCYAATQTLTLAGCAIGMALMVYAFTLFDTPVEAILPTASASAFDDFDSLIRPLFYAACAVVLLVATLAVVSTVLAPRRPGFRFCALTVAPLFSLAVLVLFVLAFALTQDRVLPDLDDQLSCNTAAPVTGCSGAETARAELEYCQYAYPDECCYECTAANTSDCCTAAYCVSNFADGAYAGRAQLEDWCDDRDAGDAFWLAGFVLLAVSLSIQFLASCCVGCGSTHEEDLFAPAQPLESSTELSEPPSTLSAPTDKLPAKGSFEDLSAQHPRNSQPSSTIELEMISKPLDPRLSMLSETSATDEPSDAKPAPPPEDMVSALPEIEPVPLRHPSHSQSSLNSRILPGRIPSTRPSQSSIDFTHGSNVLDPVDFERLVAELTRSDPASPDSFEYEV